MLTTLISLLAILATSESYDASMSPEFTAENLNLTFHWNPPDSINLTRNEVLLYTVVRQTGSKENVPWCVNITATVCWLVELFQRGDDFGSNEIYFVRYLSNERQSIKGRSKKIALLYHYVNISAPVIYNTTITSRNATIRVHGPETPFVLNNRTRLMGEDRLGRDLVTRSFSIKYASSITNLDDSDEGLMKKDWTQSHFGNLSINYRYLKPYTNYRIAIRSKLERSDTPSKDVATMDFRTKQEAPELAPMIMGTTVLTSSCDVREVLVTWQESSHQRRNVNITDYTVTVVGSKSSESDLVHLPGDTFAVSLSSLNRWEKYALSVTSTNSVGSKTSDVYNITEDPHDKDSYKPTDLNISLVSSGKWELVWSPSVRHEECTLGFEVTTFVHGIQEETVTVLGNNESSAILHFQQVARYTVEVAPIMNDSAQTEVSASIDYIVKGWNFPRWAILTSVIFLLVIMLIAVIFISNKVCCDLQELPDISKSRPMRIASRNEGYVPSLKSPPEKEVFNRPNSKPIEVKETKNDVNECSYSDDEVFESKACHVDPSSSMPNYTRLDRSPDPIDGSSPKSTVDNEDAYTADETSQSEENKITAIVTGPSTDPHDITSRDSYVSCRSSCKVPPKNSVYIPNQPRSSFRSGNLSTQSSDSGISSPTYGGSLSDYVPPSPFSDSDQSSVFYGYDFGSASPYVTAALAGSSTSVQSSPFSEIDQNSTFSAYDFGSESPYVTAALAASSGKRLSSSSGSDEEQSSYKRISSKDSIQNIRGYLPMIPASPCKKK